MSVCLLGTAQRQTEAILRLIFVIICAGSFLVRSNILHLYYSDINRGKKTKNKKTWVYLAKEVASTKDLDTKPDHVRTYQALLLAMFYSRNKPSMC